MRYDVVVEVSSPVHPLESDNHNTPKITTSQLLLTPPKREPDSELHRPFDKKSCPSQIVAKLTVGVSPTPVSSNITEVDQEFQAVRPTDHGLRGSHL